jgi:hypothetical protein
MVGLIVSLRNSDIESSLFVETEGDKVGTPVEQE